MSMTSIEEMEKEQAESALAWSKLSDAEAKARMQDIKTQIKELNVSDLTKDPIKLKQLEELTVALHWCKANKYRSKYFRITSLGRSLRKARRHPENGSRSIKINRKARQKRETV